MERVVQEISSNLGSSFDPEVKKYYLLYYNYYFYQQLVK